MTITLHAYDSPEGFILRTVDNHPVGSVVLGDQYVELTVGVGGLTHEVGDSFDLDQKLYKAGYTLAHDDRDRVHALVDGYGDEEED